MSAEYQPEIPEEPEERHLWHTADVPAEGRELGPHGSADGFLNPEPDDSVGAPDGCSETGDADDVPEPPEGIADAPPADVQPPQELGNATADEPERPGPTLPEGSYLRFDTYHGRRGAWRDIEVMAESSGYSPYSPGDSPLELTGREETSHGVQADSLAICRSSEEHGTSLVGDMWGPDDDPVMMITFYQPATSEAGMATLKMEAEKGMHNVTRLQSLLAHVPALKEPDTIVRMYVHEPEPPADAPSPSHLTQPLPHQVVHGYLNARYTFPANWVRNKDEAPPAVPVVHDLPVGTRVIIESRTGLVMVSERGGRLLHYFDPRDPAW